MTEQHRCERGAHCLSAIRDVDQLVPAECDRPLCDPCESAARRALEQAPELYTRLRVAARHRDIGPPPEHTTRGGITGSPMLLGARPTDLAEQAHWLLTTWEDEVRSIASLTYPDRTRKPEARQVQDAAILLGRHFTAWLSAPLTEFETSRWTPVLNQSGVEAVCQLLDWRNAVRRLPGLDVAGPRAVRRYPQPCPSCDVAAITHHAGDDLAECQSCGATAPYGALGEGAA